MVAGNFEDAQNAYIEGDYSRAFDLFTRLAEQGVGDFRIVNGFRRLKRRWRELLRAEIRFKRHDGFGFRGCGTARERDFA